MESRRMDQVSARKYGKLRLEVFVSVFKMGLLTFLICLGTAGYVWCNWTSEKMLLNDIKDSDYCNGLDPKDFSQCRYCGEYYLRGGSCYNQDCPGKR